MKQYKNIRVSDNVLQELKAMQKDSESVQVVLIDLCNTLSDLFEDISRLEFRMLCVAQSPDILIFEVERAVRGLEWSIHRAKRFEYIFGSLKNTIRLPIGCFACMDILKVHPDETYNTAVFKLICVNKVFEMWDKEFN